MNQRNTEIYEIFKDFTSYKESYPGAMYMQYYNTPSNCYRIMLNENGEPIYKSCLDGYKYNSNIQTICLNDRIFIKNFMKLPLFNNEIFIAQYSGSDYLLYADKHSGCPEFMIFLSISDDTENDGVKFIYLWTDNIKEVFNMLKPCICKFKRPEKITFGITAMDVSNSLYTSYYDYDISIKNDIKNNYNDDLPLDKIYSLIETQNRPDLLLFYGEPGTGKSTLIKHLISKYNDKDFVFVDGTILENTQHEKLMSYFIENKDAIFIFEDCEKILLDRKNYVNPVMSILLNISDGIIGDVLGIKIICTFNTDLNKIDKALLRKGRLSLKYEFKKLSKEKCRQLLSDNNINEDMSLADIYHIDDENDFSKDKKYKIGF